MDLAGIADPAEAYEAMSRVAKQAEERGFYLAWLYDHLLTVPRPTQEITFECWTSMPPWHVIRSGYALGKW
jgi:alkanesulfonate monooxygenase SsuD/methylene tetrahydromethanopterin reductase-like flavin-dependent oxidoreductase (luciferase family)